MHADKRAQKNDKQRSKALVPKPWVTTYANMNIHSILHSRISECQSDYEEKMNRWYFRLTPSQECRTRTNLPGMSEARLLSVTAQDISSENEQEKNSLELSLGALRRGSVVTSVSSTISDVTRNSLGPENESSFSEFCTDTLEDPRLEEQPWREPFSVATTGQQRASLTLLMFRTKEQSTLRNIPSPQHFNIPGNRSHSFMEPGTLALLDEQSESISYSPNESEFFDASQSLVGDGSPVKSTVTAHEPEGAAANWSSCDLLSEGKDGAFPPKNDPPNTTATTTLVSPDTIVSVPIRQDKEEKILETLREIVRKCTNADPSKRPTAREVLNLLNCIVRM